VPKLVHYTDTSGLKGTLNREQGTGNMPCSPSVPGTCSKPLRENPSLKMSTSRQRVRFYLEFSFRNRIRIAPLKSALEMCKIYQKFDAR